MPARKPAGRDTVELLGKRRLQIAGAQARFDMRERNAEIERGQRRHQNGRGVALRHDHIRLMLADHFLERSKQGAGENGKRARFRIDRYAIVRLDAKPGERLFRQCRVLAGTNRRHLRIACEAQNDRRQFDRLGPRPHHTQKPHWTSCNHRQIVVLALVFCDVQGRPAWDQRRRRSSPGARSAR